MDTSLLPPKRKLKIASKLVKGNYYYIYELSDSLKSSEDSLKEINDDTKFCRGKFDHFDRRNNIFVEVKCPKNEYFETRRFSIINNLFLEEEKNCCCKILDGKSMRRRRIRKTRVKKIRSKRKSKSPKKK